MFGRSHAPNGSEPNYYNPNRGQVHERLTTTPTIPTTTTTTTPKTTKKMGDAQIKAAHWRLVEVGRIVLISGGKHQGKLATIVEIIDHKRALIDGPATDSKAAVPRQAIALSECVLTPLIIAKLPRGARTGPVKRAWEAAGIEKKWQESAWAKKRARQERRKNLTDFERFKVMRLKKGKRFETLKSAAKAKTAAKA